MNRAAALPLVAALCAGCASTGPLTPPGVEEWVWDGRVRIDRFIEIPEGVTLRIRPGTILEFTFDDRDGDGYGDNGLHVKGRITAVGSEAAPVIFTSAAGEKEPGDWAGLLLDNSEGSLFDRCTFEYARHAFHSHFSGGRILRSRIVNNIEGTRLGDSRFEIAWSLITGNVSKGLNFRSCANRIHHNTISGNGTGIFLYETDRESSIEENNIFGNEGYDFRIGDFYEGGKELRGNWWGTAEEGEIRRRIFEGDDPSRAGRVTISPAQSPVATGWEEG